MKTSDSSGWIDLFISNGGLSGAYRNFLLRNESGGGFTRVMDGPVVADSLMSGGSTWVDYDLDGDVDLFVPGVETRLYRNDGEFRFAPVDDALFVTEPPLLLRSLAGAWGDYDNDEDPDLYMGFDYGEMNRLYVNHGDGTFTRGDARFATLDGGMTTQVHWADLDNNGYLDILVAHWGAPVYVYLNHAGTFERALLGDLGAQVILSSSMATADYDGDGDLDVLVGNWPNHPGPGEENHLYRNDGPVGNWLRLDLEGTRSNRSAIGARVTAEVMLDGRIQHLTREVRSQDGWRSQHGLTVHFGLGQVTEAREIVIHWPSGTVQRLEGIAANRRITVVER